MKLCLLVPISHSAHTQIMIWQSRLQPTFFLLSVWLDCLNQIIVFILTWNLGTKIKRAKLLHVFKHRHFFPFKNQFCCWNSESLICVIRQIIEFSGNTAAWSDITYSYTTKDFNNPNVDTRIFGYCKARTYLILVLTQLLSSIASAEYFLIFNFFLFSYLHLL